MHCAFIETFGQATGKQLVSAVDLARRTLARIETGRPLVLVDLTGPGLAQIGADERLCVGAHEIAQQWSLAFWSHPSQPDGIYYRARHDPSRSSVALYDRVAGALRTAPQGLLTEERNTNLLADILETYRFGLR